MVSILESEPHSDPDNPDFTEIAALQGFLVTWDGTKAQLLNQFGYGTPQAIPSNHAFDINQVIHDYLRQK